MNSFFAALGTYYEDRLDRVNKALDNMEKLIQQAELGTDPLNLEDLHEIQAKINPRKINVGLATRRLLTTAFKEYFRDEGLTPFTECWQMAASLL